MRRERDPIAIYANSTEILRLCAISFSLYIFLSFSLILSPRFILGFPSSLAFHPPLGIILALDKRIALFLVFKKIPRK